MRTPHSDAEDIVPDSEEDIYRLASDDILCPSSNPYSVLDYPDYPENQLGLPEYQHMQVQNMGVTPYYPPVKSASIIDEGSASDGKKRSQQDVGSQTENTQAGAVLELEIKVESMHISIRIDGGAVNPTFDIIARPGNRGSKRKREEGNAHAKKARLR